VGAAGLLADVTSGSNWFILTACAVVPATLLVRFWNRPDESMTESIHRVLR
jgi:hypothetical protein